MARRGTEMTDEQLHDKVRARIRAQNWYTRESVILSLFALYRIDPSNFFDPPPGSKSSFSEEDGRPVAPVPGVLDQDAKACLDNVVKMLAGVDHKLVVKIIRLVAQWCDINVFYQPKFRDASFVAARNEAANQVVEQIDSPGTIVAPSPSTSIETESSPEPASEAKGIPDPSTDDELDEFFGIAAPTEVIRKPMVDAAPQNNDPPKMIEMEPEPETNIVAEQVDEDDEGDDPFGGLGKEDSDDDDPFNV